MMCDETECVPQVSNPIGDLTVDSDRVKAPVVDAGLMDSGGGQLHIIIDTEATALQQKIQEAENTEKEQLQRMSDVLRKMRQATTKQKNVSMDIKNGLQHLEESLDAIKQSRYLRQKAKETLESRDRMAVSPATPSQTVAPKRSRTNNDSPDDTVTSRQKKLKPHGEQEWQEVRRMKKAISVRAKKDPSAKDPASNQMQKVQGGQSKEESAEPRCGRNRIQRITKVRGGAVLIKPESGKTYAQILQTLKSTVNPEESKAVIQRIRKTHNGSVLLELGKGTEDRLAFQKAIQEAIGQSGKVQDLVHKITLEIRDLDCLTTKEEVEDALKRETNCIGDLKVHVFDPNRREQRMALVEVDESTAAALLLKERIRVGWVNCRLRKRIVVPRCFRCLGYGHLRTECKGSDRTDLCWKCGQSDHKAVSCINRPRCFLCTELGRPASEVVHVPGSGTCVAFRAALEYRRKMLRR